MISGFPVHFYFDTSTLITIAADPALGSLVKELFAGKGGVPCAVVTELEQKFGDQRVGQLARIAFKDIEWLGEPIPVDTDELRQEVELIQNKIAAGRSLQHPLQHYGESAMIVLAARDGARCFTEDHDARIAAKCLNVVAISCHRLISLLIQDGKLADEEGLRMVEVIRDKGRGQDYTLNELREGGPALGRVWMP